jgi:hypothetical protein
MLLTAQLGLHGAGAVTLVDRVLPTQVALQETSVAQSGGETAFTLAGGATDPATRAAEVAAMEDYGRDETVAWSAYLGRALDRPGERALQKAYESRTISWPATAAKSSSPSFLNARRPRPAL